MRLTVAIIVCANLVEINIFFDFIVNIYVFFNFSLNLSYWNGLMFSLLKWQTFPILFPQF